VVLTQNGRATAVVQGMETCQRRLDAVTLLKLAALGESEITKGKLTPQRQVFSDLRKQISKARGLVIACNGLSLFQRLGAICGLGISNDRELILRPWRMLYHIENDPV
jgi:hypothetical protein